MSLLIAFRYVEETREKTSKLGAKEERRFESRKLGRINQHRGETTGFRPRFPNPRTAVRDWPPLAKISSRGQVLRARETGRGRSRRNITRTARRARRADPAPGDARTIDGPGQLLQTARRHGRRTTRASPFPHRGERRARVPSRVAASPDADRAEGARDDFTTVGRFPRAFPDGASLGATPELNRPPPIIPVPPPASRSPSPLPLAEQEA